MATHPKSRAKFDEKTKLETVVSILRGELSLADAAKQHGLQSYQLHAWIGQIAMDRPERVYEALEHRFGNLHSDTGVMKSIPATTPPGATTTDLTTEVMAAYLRKVLGRG